MSITARVLVIDPDRESLVELQRALADAGLTNVAAVPSGSFALTMIERDRPDLIVSRARVSDIDGFELCSIVRSDPALSGVLFLLLLAGPEEDVPAGALGEGPDRVLVGEFTTGTIVSEVVSLLRPEVVVAAVPDAAQSLGGSLGIMDLPDLTQAIALGGKTGTLVLTLGAGPGLIVFERGRIVHAEFEGLGGERAFTALVAAACRQGGGSFVFNPLEAPGPELPRTITRPVKQLLLDTAAEIDEGRAGPSAIAPIS